MSIDTSLRGFIDSNISNSAIKKELIKKLDDNILTGTEISLIENELQKADPKNAQALITEFEEALKSKLNITVPAVKEIDFNASSFKFNVGSNKFVKEIKAPESEKNNSQALSGSQDEPIFKSNTVPRADKVGKEVEPVITNHKNDTENLEVKKFSTIKKEDVESFKKIFPDAKGMPPALGAKESDEFALKAFGMNAKDLQELIGEKGGTGKLTPKTMFLVKEHLAKMSNSANTFEDCQKVISQFDKFKSAAKGVSQDSRFGEIENNLKLKTTNIIHDDINKQTSLSGIESSIKKSDFLKKDKMDNLSLGNWKSEIDAIDSEPNNARLKGAASDRIKTVLLNKMSSATLEEMGDLSKYLTEKSPILTDSDKKLLTSTFNSKISTLLSARFDNIKTSSDCLDFKYDLENFKENIAPETLNIFKSQLSTKSVVSLDKEIKSLKNPKPSDLRTLEKNLYYLKDAIPKGSFKPLENSFKVQDRISKIYGEQGIQSNDIRQGGLGDCYFMAALSGMAKHRPQDIAKMISYNDDCSIIFVKFPGQKDAIGVAYPTQDELDKYAKGGKDGDVWVAAVEKAYAYTTAFRDQEGNKDNPRENIANGGQLSTGIEVLTNKSTDDDILALTKDSTIRSKLTKALSANKMVTVATTGSSDSTTVANLPQNHAYTVLSYDPKTDKVTLRNPWGGDANGDKDYRGKKNDGVFEVSISELNKYFRNITYEE